jgi:hypothetical protein
VQKEKLGGYVGLGRFFLFPLAGLLQMRDGDEALRAAVVHARPSVVPLYVAGEPTQPVACALVLQKSPLRAVVTGRVGATSFVTPVAGGTITWRPLCEDALGEFALLEGDGPKTALAVAMTGPAPRSDAHHLSEVVPIDPASFGDLEPSEEAPQAIVAALVSPAQLAPLWIGELQVDAAKRPASRGRCCARCAVRKRSAAPRRAHRPPCTQRSSGRLSCRATASCWRCMPGSMPECRVPCR